MGISLPQLGPQSTRGNIIQLAQDAEEEGFDSLWVLERLLWPLEPSVPYPSTPDGKLPTEYQNVLDPLEVLTFVAAKTEKIGLGTAVVDMFVRSPVLLARSLATLDILSQGRLLIGLGIGAFKEEYQASSVPFQHRGERANEYLKLLRRIWTDDVVDFTGEFYSIPASKIGPKPLQKPHIPIYLGGFTPKTFERIVKYEANGWIGGINGPWKHFENGVKMLKDEGMKVDKGPDQFKVIVLTWPHVNEEAVSSESNQSQEIRVPFTGTVPEIGNDIQRLSEMGVEHVIFNYNFLPDGRNIKRVIDISRKLAKFVK